ncbi:MAG: hypothetical protein LBB56_02540 [Chitinispirillales bacterium]|jgi:hypothetical protein|nr:hypothetical protein [Chitinispirillales bacterium]
MKTIDFETVFHRLNDVLSEIEQQLELVCCGGYVMQLHGYKATVDVDAFFTTNVQIDKAIKKVGDEFGINMPDELWLNNSVANLNPIPPAGHQEPVFQLSNLTVKAVDMVYLMGMKLRSGRSRDIKDVAAVLADDADKDPLQLFEMLRTIGFNIDISTLLEAFGLARGLAWLSDFYTARESELEKYF